MRLGASLAAGLLGCSSPEPAEPEVPLVVDVCPTTELEYAPAPTTIDGLSTVPMDLISIEAVIEFDPSKAAGRAGATVRFRLATPGMPVFDLRQTPDSVELDGRPIDPEQIARHDFGLGMPAGLRVLAVELSACREHELVIEYPIAVPAAEKAGGLSWRRNRAELHFDVWMSDLFVGRYLESWLPATLPYDEFSLSLGIDLQHAGSEHILMTNAEVDELAPHRWQLEFPPTTRVYSPFLAIAPSSEIAVTRGVHGAVNGQDIEWWLYSDRSVTTPTDATAGDLGVWLDEFVISTGPYQHPRLTIYLGEELRSMEYEGAVTSKPEALQHELFHNWWARGVEPPRHADGWIDEAWDVYNTGPNRFAVAPFVWTAKPVQMANPHPFARSTPMLVYESGRRFFAGIAAIVGVARLRETMAALYRNNPTGSLTSELLERELACASENRDEVRRAFHRFVHGLDSELPPSSATAECPANLPPGRSLD